MMPLMVSCPGGNFQPASSWSPPRGKWRRREAPPMRADNDSARAWGVGRMPEARPPQPPQPPPRGARRSASRPPAVGVSEAAGHDAGWTTVMLKHLPAEFMRDDLIQLLDSQGFAGKYDFAYVPVKFETLRSLGHAFVNFVSPEDTARAWDRFEGFADWAMPSARACAVAWNDKYQGFEALVDRYRDCPVMHDLMPDVCKPILLSSGRRIAFPPPLRPIRARKEVRTCLQCGRRAARGRIERAAAA